MYHQTTNKDKIKSNQQQCDRSDTNKVENITAGSVEREKRDGKCKIKTRGRQKERDYGRDSMREDSEGEPITERTRTRK